MLIGNKNYKKQWSDYSEYINTDIYKKGREGGREGEKVTQSRPDNQPIILLNLFAIFFSLNKFLRLIWWLLRLFTYRKLERKK